MASDAQRAAREPTRRWPPVVAGLALALVAAGILAAVHSRHSPESRLISCLREHGWRAIDAPTKLFNLRSEDPTFEGTQEFPGDVLMGLIDSGNAAPQPAVVLIGGRLDASSGDPPSFAPFIRDAQLYPHDFAAVLVSATDNSSGRIACEHAIDPGLSSVDEF